MKFKLLLIGALMIFAQNAFAQSRLTDMLSASHQNKPQPTAVKMNTTYLLLGTLNDYLSRKYMNNEGEFDRYYAYEQTLKQYVDSVVKKEFNISMVEKYDHFVSDKMSEKMNGFYRDDHLIDSMLYINAEDGLSFLTGVYLRYGEKINGRLYKIWLKNSDKHLNCYELLKILGCEHIYYKHLNNIPASDFLYFEATPMMEKYFATVALYQERIWKEQLSFYFKNAANPKSAYQKIFGGEHLKVQNLFGGRE